MRRARPSELCSDVVPVVQASIPHEYLCTLIPVRMSELDSLTEPEPSIGALLGLRDGLLAVAVYGLNTSTLTLHLPQERVSHGAINSLLAEVPIPGSSILWSLPLEPSQELASI